jgi:hypothetical protein
LRRPRPDRRAIAAIVVTALSAVAPCAAAAAPSRTVVPPASTAATTAAPTTAGQTTDTTGGSSSQYADPFTTLGATSPFCSRPVGRAARLDCRVSGSVAHPYPLSSYGLDQHVPTGVTHFGDNILAALQMMAEFVWFALVLVLKGVLLLLEWAFSLDLLNTTMASVKSALDSLHNTVLGRPWFLLAVSVAGLWGIWRGLVQRRTIETLGGLAATVALMVAALVLISNPSDTVGHASQLGDEAALGVVSGTATGDVGRPDQSFATALQGVFRTTVLKPWAALEFGDTRWALAPAKPGSRITNADVWLAFPAGSDQRSALYKLQKGGASTGVLDFLGNALRATVDPIGNALTLLHELGSPGSGLPHDLASYVHKDPSKVRIQEAGGTFPRLALLVLVAIGLTGAILLFLYVGVKLLLASVMSLLLVLLAPAMLLAPAFGQSGRATTVAWAKRLAGALAAKLIYALLLAVLIVASSAIDSLQIGWFGTWLILIAFWWGALLKRRELVGFVAVGQAERDSGAAAGARMLRGFYALRIAGSAVGSLRSTPVGTLPRRPPPHRRHPGREAGSAHRDDPEGEREPPRAPTDVDAAEPAGGTGAQGEISPRSGLDPRPDRTATPPPAAGSPQDHRRPGSERVATSRRRDTPRADVDHVAAATPGEPVRVDAPPRRNEPRVKRSGRTSRLDGAAPPHREPSPEPPPGAAAADRPRPIDHRDHLAALAERRREERSATRDELR